ncbi:MAG: DUF115 domain-containing protein [Treponemataceae bacterium]|nr:DUF115 domain-containing protein [Treponemataceae bacterium]
MSSDIFYTGTREAKNGSIVPVLSNGKTFYSEYNPDRDIGFYADKAEIVNSGFILIGGLGDGSHIAAVLDKNPSATIMILEFNDETIAFLFSNKICDPEILENPHIILTTPEKLCRDIKNNYIPIIQGSFLYHPVKMWQLLFEKEYGTSLKDKIKETLHDIASDYATQARFGKLMFTNILKNMALLSGRSKNKNLTSVTEFAGDSRKAEAAVIGAGPSLDESIKLLKKNKERFFIISTDTAYRSLYKNAIKPDLVVTIDGQNSSISHFLGIDSSETAVAADICANAAAARYLAGQGCPISFFTTGHPMGTLINDWYKNESKANRSILPLINAGFGTVLSAAADLAVKAGFTSIHFFGADFAYESGKPYTKGTYLDENFLTVSNRHRTLDNSFCALCYRTELTKEGRLYTNSLLSSYKRSLNFFIESRSENFYFESTSDKIRYNSESVMINKGKAEDSAPLYFDYECFFNFLMTRLVNEDKSILYSLLPFATWLKEKEKNADINDIYMKAIHIMALHRS